MSLPIMALSSGPPRFWCQALIGVPGRPSAMAVVRKSSVATRRKFWFASAGALSAA